MLSVAANAYPRSEILPAAFNRTKGWINTGGQTDNETNRMISQRAKYALRALVSLAKAGPGETLFIGDISREQAIPKKFLEQILLQLKANGIVTSRRGKAGGYLLLKRADQITYGEILRIIDGPIAPLPCLSRVAYRRCEDCSSEQSCEVRRVFARVAEASRNVLDGMTIMESIAQPAEARIPMEA